VHALIERQLPSDRHDTPTWRHVCKKLDEAARGGDVSDAAVSLQIALHLRRRGVPAEVTPGRFRRRPGPSRTITTPASSCAIVRTVTAGQQFQANARKIRARPSGGP